MWVLVPVNLKKIRTIQLLNCRDKYCVVSLALKQGLNDENASHKQHAWPAFVKRSYEIKEN